MATTAEAALRAILNGPEVQLWDFPSAHYVGGNKKLASYLIGEFRVFVSRNSNPVGILNAGFAIEFMVDRAQTPTARQYLQIGLGTFCKDTELEAICFLKEFQKFVTTGGNVRDFEQHIAKAE